MSDELVKYSLNKDLENYIEHIYYEFETDKAVKFGRNIDEKVLWIPKRLIKGGWKKDKQMPQNVKVKFAAELYRRNRDDKTK